MALDLTACTNERLYTHGPDVLLCWDSTVPAGTVFQVYVDRRLVRATTARRVRLPTDAARRRIDVGAVAAGEAHTDLGATIPAPGGTGDRAVLTWTGGLFLARDPGFTDLENFRIYGEATPGGGVDYTRPRATVAAYPGGDLAPTGFGMGGFGQGGWGLAATAYRWTSGPLGAGTWTFAVKAAGRGGIEGPAATASVTIVTAPAPPAPQPDGSRLAITCTAGSAALTWRASPG